MLQTKELEVKVFEAIHGLPEDLKMALTLREMDGMSYEDIADMVGCPIGTVRSRIFRAREALDKVIKPLID
jgi:RNA polymerase sigma-70 factor (ECF subfamily)